MKHAFSLSHSVSWPRASKKLGSFLWSGTSSLVQIIGSAHKLPSSSISRLK